MLTALAVGEAQRYATRGSARIAQSVQTYQAAAVALSLETTSSILAEQGISQTSDATVLAGSLLTATQATASMLAKAADEQAMLTLVQTLVADASRTARLVDQATRPAVTGWVRALRLPSCGRCVILAGRVYRYSQGFLRHPGCDCMMAPTTEKLGREFVVDPQEAFDRGQVKGLSKADTLAVRAGADLAQVVNVRRRQAGLTLAGSVMIRAGRMTPAACLFYGTDREDSLALLRRFGYIV